MQSKNNINIIDLDLIAGKKYSRISIMYSTVGAYMALRYQA